MIRKLHLLTKRLDQTITDFVVRMADFEGNDELTNYSNEALRGEVQSLSNILQKISLNLHNIEGQAKKKRIENFVEAVETELLDEESEKMLPNKCEKMTNN